LQMFPYYIVRFKHSNTIKIICQEYEFPYYIVRFKPNNLTLCGSDKSLFPYYIVRFKRLYLKFRILHY